MHPTTSPTNPGNSASEFEAALQIYETEKKLQFEQAKFVFEQSRTYHTVVMGLAYGGFFAIWSAAKNITNETSLLAFSGAAMLFSISAFVLFTILNMYVLQKATLRHAHLAQKFNSAPHSAQELEAIAYDIAAYRERLNADIKAVSVRVALLWPWFFFPSLVSGIAAVLLLLFIYVKHIV